MRGCKPLNETEIAHSLAALKTARDRALFITGYRTGLRISELTALKVKDVSFNWQVLDRVNLERKNTKGKTFGRSFPLHKEVKEAIQLWLNELSQEQNIGGDTFLFKSRNHLNDPIKRCQAWNIIKTAFILSNITGKTGTHSMRKTFAKKIYERTNKDIVATKQALGHSDINSTASYLSFADEALTSIILED